MRSIGTWLNIDTRLSSADRVLDEFISTRKKMEGKVGAAFATSGDPTGGKETTMFSIIQALMIYEMIIVGDPMSATGHYGVACSGEPDEKTLENWVGADIGLSSCNIWGVEEQRDRIAIDIEAVGQNQFEKTNSLE